MRRAQSVGSFIAVLLLIGACLGTSGGGESCSCRPGPGRAPSTSSAPPANASAREGAPADPAEAPAGAAGGEVAPAPAGAVVLPEFDDPVWTRVASRAGKYVVCWRSLSGKVPRNEDFELEVWVLRDGAPVGEALLEVSGWMPEHGHGMLRKTRTVQREDGSFRVEGMLLHMRGKWQLLFDVLEGSLAETAESVLEL